MRVSIKTLFLIAVSLAPAARLSSQTSWNLDQCISYALENNIHLKQEMVNIDKAKNNLSLSRFEALPSVNGGIGQTFRFGRSVDPLTYVFTTNNSTGSSFYTRSQMDIFKGFHNYHTIKKKNLELKKSIENLKWAKNDLSLNITSLFLQIMFNQDLVEIAKNQINITEQQIKQTGLLVNAGSLTKGDLLEIQAQLANDKLELVNTQNTLDLSVLDLAQLLDLKNPENFTIDRPEFTETDPLLPTDDPEQIYNYAVNSLPRIKSAQINVESAERNLKIAKSALSPRLSVVTSYGTGYSDQILDILSGQVMPFYNQLQFASTSSISFHVIIPVFNKFSTFFDIKNARLDVLNSGYEFELAKNQLRKEIQQASADALAAMKRYQATVKSVASLEESFSYTEEKFNLGVLTSFDYISAKNKLTTARTMLLQAKYAYIFNSKILGFYKGLSLKM